MATNPYVNKVIYGNDTVMDISDTTATEGDVVRGKTFYKASGAKGVGSAVIPDISNCYQTTDNAETDIQDADYFPFLDSSASEKKKTLWSNIKAKLKTYFDTLYATYIGAEGLIKTTVGWSVKNILNCDIASGSHTKNGLTIYVSKYIDGTISSIKVSGTATANTLVEVASSVSDNIYGELTGNTYILNGCPSGGSSSTYGLLISGDYGSEYTDYGDGVLIANGVLNGKVYIVVANGYTANNLYFYPMIRNKNVADATYERYYENVNSKLDKKADISDIPDVSNLVPEVLLKDTVGWVGKNKIPATLDSVKSLNTLGTWNGNVYTRRGNTFTVNTTNDGYIDNIVVGGTNDGTGEAVLELAHEVRDYLEVGNSYYWSGCPSGGSASTYGFNVRYYGYEYGSGKNFTLANQSGNIWYGIVVFKDCLQLNNIVFKPFLIDADIADHTYEPYHPPVSDVITDVYGVMGENGAKNSLQIPSSVVTTTINGITFTVTRNSAGQVTEIDANGVNDNTDASRFYILGSASTFVPVQNKAMIANGCNGGSASTYCLVVHGNNSSSGQQAEAHDIYDGDEPVGAFPYCRAYVLVKKGASVDHVKFYPMLRDARDTNPDFEPYAMTNRELTDAVTLFDDKLTTTYTTEKNTLYKVGKIVYCYAKITGVTASVGDTIATVPNGYKPVTEWRALDANAKLITIVDSAGAIKMGENVSNRAIHLFTSWITS